MPDESEKTLEGLPTDPAEEQPSEQTLELQQKIEALTSEISRLRRDPQTIRRLGALQIVEEGSRNVDDFLLRQRAVYEQTSREELIETLVARDRQLVYEGRQMADGRIGGRLLREFVRGVLSAADRNEPQRIEQILQALGAEPADARQLRLRGTTLGDGLGPEERLNRFEQLASGDLKK